MKPDKDILTVVGYLAIPVARIKSDSGLPSQIKNFPEITWK